MPFTPLHLGPGLVLKAFAPRHFSLMVFGLSQVLIDLEPLYYLFSHSDVVHRFFHPYTGAGLVAVVSFFPGRQVCSWMLRSRNSSLIPAYQRRSSSTPQIPALSAAVAAILGGFSHIALDSVMHADVRPFYPLSDKNPILDMISIDHIYSLCLVLGLTGLAILMLRRLLQREKAQARLMR
jgi:hypothetical protein